MQRIIMLISEKRNKVERNCKLAIIEAAAMNTT
jgi:hypothetical protein